MDDNYNERLLKFITDYTRSNGVPPTLELMIQNVEGRTSKSTLHRRLKKMVSVGLLVQKGKLGLYYPTSIDDREVSVPLFLLEKACKALASDGREELAKALRKYL